MAVNSNKKSALFDLSNNATHQSALEQLLAEADIIVTDRELEVGGGKDLKATLNRFPDLIHISIDKGPGELELQQRSGLCGRNYMDNRSAITMKGNNTRL